MVLTAKPVATADSDFLSKMFTDPDSYFNNPALLSIELPDGKCLEARGEGSRIPEAIRRLYPLTGTRKVN